MKDHISRRRRIASVFSKTSIQSSPHIKKIIEVLLFERLLPQLSKSAEKGTSVEVLALNSAYGLDFVSAFTFGLPRGTNFIQDTQARDNWLAYYLESHLNKYMFWSLELPSLTKFLAKIGIHVVPSSVRKARESLEAWAMERVDRTEVNIKEVGVDDMNDGDYPIFYNQLRTMIIRAQQMSIDERRIELASECLDQLGRFIGTLSTKAMSKMTFLYSRDP